MVPFVVLSLVAIAAPHEEIKGTVATVVDGDGLKILVDGKKVVIRLADIDCPDPGQRFFDEATDRLKELAADKEATVEIIGTDRYRRPLGIVRVGGVDVNETLVREGLAWSYRKTKRYAKLAAEAKQAGRGLWVDKDPVPPWDWRKRPKLTPAK